MWTRSSSVTCRSRQHGANSGTCWWRPLAALQSMASTVGCWRNVWGGLFRGPQVLGQRPRATTSYRPSKITHQHSALLSHFGRRDSWSRCASPPPSCRSSSHGSYPMAALFTESTMKTKVFLLLLAAIGCRLALCDPNAVEELQVETLVSKTSASHRHSWPQRRGWKTQ